jgi:metallo-beta-lactamase family protein
LGSCFIRFEVNASGKSIVFSGDIGPKDTPLLPDPDIPGACDLMVLESTYGNRIHDDRTRRIKRLEQVLLRALSDGGKVFIPAFALGRCQELMYEMDRVFAGTAFDKPIPVFLDSPLGLTLTGIYSNLSPYWDETARGYLKHGDHPIDFESLYGVKQYKHHLQLIDLPGPAIIIAGSGMCTGGRILSHLAQGLEDPKNDILFVGYQAPGTLGKEIATYSEKPNGYVVMDGQRVEIKARVNVLSGYSAHADQQGLVDWVGAMEQRPKEIRLVHGDPGAKKALAEKLGI